MKKISLILIMILAFLAGFLGGLVSDRIVIGDKTMKAVDFQVIGKNGEILGSFTRSDQNRAMLVFHKSQEQADIMIGRFTEGPRVHLFEEVNGENVRRVGIKTTFPFFEVKTIQRKK